MAKFCPILNRKVVYLDCLECDDKQCEKTKTKQNNKGETEMNARILTQKEVEELRNKYPKGTKIRLIKMDDPYPIPEGMIGEVDLIDDGGNVWMKWLNGRTLPLNTDIDDFEVIKPVKVTLAWDNGTNLTRIFARESEAIVFVAEAKTTCKEKKWFPPKVTYQDTEAKDLLELVKNY